MKILIIGNARHGKDTFAEILSDVYGFKFEGSSVAASRIFLYDKLKDKYGYKTPEECFQDRVNHRAEWYDEICEYNKKDKIKLAKAILKTSDIYVGMRDGAELQAAKRQHIFDQVIGVFNPRMPLEDKSSFNIDLWKESDFVVPNAGTIADLREKVIKLERFYE